MRNRFDDTERLRFELIARRLRAMADPSRLAVLHTLCEGEQCVTELMRATGFGQTNVSKHLRILREEGLVIARRDHRRVFYRLSSRMPEEICTLMCRSMERRAAGERSLLAKYLGRRRFQETG